MQLELAESRDKFGLTPKERLELEERADKILAYYRNKPTVSPSEFSSSTSEKVKNIELDPPTYAEKLASTLTTLRGEIQNFFNSSFQRENLIAGLSGIYELTRMYTRMQLAIHGVDIATFDPITYFILNNSGDFMNGYTISFYTNSLSKLLRIPEKVRRPLSFLAGTSAVVIAESVLPVGYPDYMDIPAGILGSAVYDQFAFKKREATSIPDQKVTLS